MKTETRHLRPHKAGHGWWYEDDKGIDVYAGEAVNGRVFIPYRYIENAAQRAKERAATTNNTRKPKR